MPQLTVEMQQGIESNNAVFTVRLSQPSLDRVQVSYRFRTGNGFGSLGPNETSSTNFTIRTLIFEPGDAVRQINFSAFGDNNDEVDESFTLELFDPVNANFADNMPVIRRTGIILDNNGSGSNLIVAVGSPYVIEGDNGSRIARFEILLSQPVGSNTTINYSTLDGTALAGFDYVARSGSVVVGAGQTSAFVDIQISGDLQNENDEFFFLKITPPGSAPSAVASVGTATIANDDNGAQPSVSLEMQPSFESDSAVFTVRLSEPSLERIELSYQFRTGNGFGSLSANETSSANFAIRTLIFEPGETVRQINFSSFGDNTDEIDESFTLELFNPVNANFVGNDPVLRSTGFALDNNGGNNLIVAVSNPFVFEENGGSRVARFEIQLSQAANVSTTMDYTTINGSAFSGIDFVARSGSVTFAAGQTRAFVAVQIIDDGLNEGDEVFFLKVTPPGTAPSAAASVGTATIANNDNGSRPSVSVEMQPGFESDNAVFTVRLSEPSLERVQMSYQFRTGNGFGSQGANETSDSNFTIRTLIFEPGEIARQIVFSSFGDNSDEIDESFTLELFSLINADFVDNVPVLRSTGIVLDNNGGNNLIVAVGSPFMVEGDGGSRVARFEILLSQTATSNLTLDYTTIDGTAVAGSDYVAQTGSVTFTAGQTRAFVDVQVNGDVLNESDEVFFLKVTPPGIAPSPLASVGEATIANDDNGSRPSVSVEMQPGFESDEAVFTVRLSEPSLERVQLSYQFRTGNGYGSQGNNEASDSNFTIRTLIFEPGVTVRQITYSSFGDNTDEVDESVTLELFSLVNADFIDNVPVLRSTGIVLDANGGADRIVAVGSPYVVEGDGGTRIARFEVLLSQPSVADITANYTTIDGSAVAGSDYVARAGAITFVAGQTRAFVDVQINGDRIREGDEVFFLKVTLVGGLPAPFASVGTASIANDDTIGSRPTVSVEMQPSFESDEAVFTARLSETSPNRVQLSYLFRTGGGLGSLATNETSNTNFTVRTLIFEPGETVRQISFSSFGDNIDEIDESFTLELFNPVNADLAENVSILRSTGIVLDNNGGNNLIVAVGSPVVLESDGGVTTARFEILLSQPAVSNITINYATADGSALAGSDYVARTGSVTFVAGQTRAFVDVQILGDVVNESDETFSLTITPPGNAPSTATSIGTATIVNEDTTLDLAFAQPGPPLIANFNPANGWQSQDQNPRTVADVNGDGFADVVGFGFAGVLVSFGSAAGTFSTARVVVNNFGQTAGWTSDNLFHRELADVNGDGRDDIIGFGVAGTLVGLARADGSFDNPTFGIANFGTNQGWSSQTSFARTVGDVNGDGRADIVGFGQAGTLVALGNGNGTFQNPIVGIANFGAAQGWSNAGVFHRELADVNFDGFDDIIGFGQAGTLVSLANGNGTFRDPIFGVGNFGVAQGWSSQDRFPRLAADVNDDGHADIVGFGANGAFIAYGNSNGGFSDAVFDTANFSPAQGWSGNNIFQRTIADINNDSLPDIVGFGVFGVLGGLNVYFG